MTAIPDIAPRGAAHRFWDSDLAYSFRRSKVTVAAGLITFIYMFCALFAPWIAPHDPYDMTNVSIMDAFLPPAWIEGGDVRFLLGTDNVGRGVLSTIIHGSRISLGVGFASVFLAATLGSTCGIYSGYELCENKAKAPGTEEYQDSEKYQIAGVIDSSKGRIDAGEFLDGKKISREVVDRAKQLIAENMKPISDVRGSSEFRAQVSQNLFEKFYQESLCR